MRRVVILLSFLEFSGKTSKINTFFIHLGEPSFRGIIIQNGHDVKRAGPKNEKNCYRKESSFSGVSILI
jgi:hypothetical protein